MKPGSTLTPDARVYVGRRDMRDGIGVGVSVVWRDEDGAEHKLDPRFDLVKHSPDGFEWAYAGSGPSQLALALLADVATDQNALVFYHRFKLAVVAKLDVEAWSLTAGEIRASLRELQRNAGVA